MAAFANRLDWSQLVLEGPQDFLHVLTPDGRIQYASPSCKAITGFEQTELEGRFVSAFIHPDDYQLFINTLSDSLSHCSPVRFIYRFRTAEWEWVVLDSCGHAHVSNDRNPAYSSHSRSKYRGFFVMARPYFNKNASLLDSFLEHTVESERLLAWRAELRREEQAQEWANLESDSSGMHFEGSACRVYDGSGVAGRAHSQTIPIAPSTAKALPHLPQRIIDGNDDLILHQSSFQETLADHSDHSKPQDTGASHVGCSFIGDAGIEVLISGSNKALPQRAQSKRNKKKEHSRMSSTHICMHCGTMVSPEWRRGPHGPKTLCNACGCRLVGPKILVAIADRNSALVKRGQDLIFRNPDIIGNVSKV